MSPVFSPDGTRIAYTTVYESSQWDTWSVPVLGGQSRLLARNASGLRWIGSTNASAAARVLFSEHTGEGIHMAITSSTEDRVAPQRVYTPPNVNGMAHRSFASPDGKWVLVIEMLGAWRPCQLASWDGRSPVREVGPAAAPCTDASWSPDGTWMYFSANAGDGFHIWRQRFPDGTPEQVTSGATEEQGVSFFSDGQSFVTSIGVEQNTVWLHTAAGDRQITSQGYAYQPKLSPDGKRLYYMLRSGVPRHTWVSGELWVTDIGSSQRQRLFPDFVIEDYALSADGTRVVFSALAERGPSPLWIGSVDGSVPPQRLGDAYSSRAVFGPNGDVFYVQAGLADGAFLYRITPDGTHREKIREELAFYLYDISADGKWAALWTKENSVAFYPLEGGSPIELCPTCGTVGAENRGVTPPVVSWSRDGKFIFLHSAWNTRETYAVPLRPGQVIPPLPAGGIRSVDDILTIQGAQKLGQLRAFQCGDPSVYVFMRVTSQRNIYRVPVS
jgi:Tol biopolymer transport system component